MTFTVTYRGADGALRTEAVEAASRADCLAQMKARGIAPMGVKVGASHQPKHSSPKHSDTVRPATSQHINIPTTIIALVVLAVIAVGGVWWWMAARSGSAPYQPPPESEISKKSSALVKEVKPAAAPKAVPETKPTPKPKPNIIDRTRAELERVRARMRNASPESLENLRRKEADLEKLLVDKKMQFHMTNVPHVAYQPFKTCTEQVMDWIFNCSVGDDPPPFVPPLDPGEMANIEAILDRTNEVIDEDTPDTAARKQMVELAKKELKEYLAQGGNAADFLHYYHQQLVNAYELRLDASRVVKEFARDAEPAEVRKFLEQTNKALADKGIGPVMLSDKMKMKIGIPVEEKEK